MRTSELNRLTNRVSGYMRDYVTLAGIEEREETITLFERIHMFFPQWIVMTCPTMHPDICYVSKNAGQLFGDQPSTGSRDPKDYQTTVQQFFNNVHEQDQNDLKSCFTFLHDYLVDIPPAEHHAYRGIMHYRYRKPDGQSIYLHDEKVVMNLRGSGNLYFSLIRDLTSEKTFRGVKLEMFRQDESLIKIAEHFPFKETGRLTKRENDLVGLIRQGLTTKEIAWYLKISHNTVRNTKSRLFEKYKVNNTVELLNMTC